VAGVSCRVYTLYGLRLETMRGWRRGLLLLSEWLACGLAQRVVCVSTSLQQAAVRLGLLAADKAVVLGAGSVSGVDATLFAPTEERLAAARQVRERLGIPQGAPVIGFVGRVTADKGVSELVAAYQSLRDAYPDLRLLLLGPFEPIDPLPARVRQTIASDPRIVHHEFVENPTVFYHVMDLLVLPSHREGFPSVALEAAAAAKPIVATAATGTVDAVVDGVTGILTPVGDVPALARAVAWLLDHPEAAHELGRAGRERADRFFSPIPVWQATVDLYTAMLRARKSKAATPSIYSPSAAR
jgi:glycosyltransferase involved in cell wall biosynthesis